MKTLSILITLFLNSLVTFAQPAELRGNVVDVRHTPISNAIVFIYDSDDDRVVKEVTTDVNGQFSASDLEVGTYNIEIYVQGLLLDETKDINLSASDNSKYMDFYVTPEEEIVLADSQLPQIKDK